MRRIAAFLITVWMSAGLALANVCSSTGSGLFSAAGTWTSCGGGIPLTTDQEVINAGHTVLLDVDGKGCTSGVGVACLNINGTLIFDDASTGRDGDGWRNFTFVADADADSEMDLQATGTFIMGKSDRLLMNSTSGTATMAIFNGGKWQTRGATWDTTVAAITDAAATAPICGNTRGRMYTITPTAYGKNAKLYRRILFKSGKARNWQFNIAAVAADGSTFTICTDETDAAQPCTAAGAPYGFCTGANTPADASCTAAATPYAACTGNGTSKNNERLKQHAVFIGARSLPSSRASVPAEYGNSVCTAAANPYPCCTGAAAGNCLGAIPAVGDAVTIIEDYSIVNVAGTNGWKVYGPALGSAPLQDSYAGNFAGGGQISGDYAFTESAGVKGLECNFQYHNVHDYATQAVALRGCQPTTVAWNVCHDAAPGAGESAGCIEIGRNVTPDPDIDSRAVYFADNLGYRTRGHAFQLFGAGDTTHILGPSKILRNLIHDGCTTNAAECNGMEWGAMDGVEAAYNLVYDICSGTPGNSQAGFSVDAGAGNLLTGAPSIHDNIILNICGSGIAEGASPGASNPVGYGGQVYGITGNYISNIKRTGIYGGNAYGNVIKNWSLRSPGAVIGAIEDAVNVKGNAAIFDDVVAGSADCTLGQFCVRLGYIWSTNDPIMSNKPTVTATDNLLSGQFIVSGGAAGTGFGPDFTGTDQSMVLQHNTCDGHGTVGHCINLGSMTPSTLRTVTVGDIAATHLGNTGQIFAKSPDANIKCVVDRLYRVAIGTASATAAASDGTCANAGSTETNSTTVGTLGLRNRFAVNFQPGAVSPLIGAGGIPVGSDVGVRAFAFNFEKWRTIWPVMSFDPPLPQSFIGAGGVDSDGDGVVDLLDNCKFVANPGQQDANNTGTGNACR